MVGFFYALICDGFNVDPTGVCVLEVSFSGSSSPATTPNPDLPVLIASLVNAPVCFANVFA